MKKPNEEPARAGSYTLTPYFKDFYTQNCYDDQKSAFNIKFQLFCLAKAKHRKKTTYFILYVVAPITSDSN